MRELHFFCFTSLGRALCVVVALKVKIYLYYYLISSSFSKHNQHFGNKMVVYFLYTIVRRKMFNKSRWKYKIAVQFNQTQRTIITFKIQASVFENGAVYSNSLVFIQGLYVQCFHLKQAYKLSFEFFKCQPRVQILFSMPFFFTHANHCLCI